jgi:hypothetical protein
MTGRDLFRLPVGSHHHYFALQTVAQIVRQRAGGGTKTGFAPVSWHPHRSELSAFISSD